MARKVILDCDPGIDDALALCLALFDPQLEVLAVTAVGGNVTPAQATRNVQAVIEQLDPPRWPRLGAASVPEAGLPVDGRNLHGSDGLGGADFEVAELHHLHPAEKVICDQIRGAPRGSVSIIALGPLTNIARAFQRDPELPGLIGDLTIMGGTVSGPGNITPAAEFNIYCDPLAAKAVLRSPSTKTLVPLDVTNRIVLTFDLLNQLPDASTKVGNILHRILPPAFRGYRQQYGLEGIHVHDTVTLMAALHPELFTIEEMAGDVETAGELTVGMTVFDRRRVPIWRRNIGVAQHLREREVIDAILRGIREAARLAG
ncbi:MAG: nucleoside hydrolase [Thermoguttaceae bacterium]|jgi:purine nucleosidase|nr:nucleoside hydrolase [Thermoguttaceae bacterium]